jgi:hypothetical protein
MELLVHVLWELKGPHTARDSRVSSIEKVFSTSFKTIANEDAGP